MSSAEVINALFERTVDIVQSLPKSGPIQTSYEEKLALYSLYKQATEGDVKSKRPGVLDMLGRAKWDAWAKRKGMGSQDSKQLYVESMLRILRQFSDRPQAIALIEELENFSGDVAQRVMSASLAHADSDSEGSSGSASPQLAPQGPSSITEEERDEFMDEERPRLSQPSRLPQLVSRPSSSQAVRGPGSTTGRMTPSSSGFQGPTRVPMPRAGRSSMMPPPPPPRSASDMGEEDDPRARRFSHEGGRLYAPPNAPRYSVAGSDSNRGAMAGGAGASLYSAVGPSSRPAGPTPSEQHFYHHHGAPRPGQSAHQGPQGTNRPEVDVALQSIQASLAALHERLNRVESRGGGPTSYGTGANAGGSGGSGGIARYALGNTALGQAYIGLRNAMHDVAVLLGLSSDGRGGAAPQSYNLASGRSRAESVAGQSTATSRRGGRGRDGDGGQGRGRREGGGLMGAPLRLMLAVVNLAMRLALDLTSVGVLLSLLIFVISKLTGRGDPLFLIRLVRRWSTLRGGARASNRAVATQQRPAIDGLQSQ